MHPCNAKYLCVLEESFKILLSCDGTISDDTKRIRSITRVISTFCSIPKQTFVILNSKLRRKAICLDLTLRTRQENNYIVYRYSRQPSRLDIVLLCSYMVLYSLIKLSWKKFFFEGQFNESTDLHIFKMTILPIA